MFFILSNGYFVVFWTLVKVIKDILRYEFTDISHVCHLDLVHPALVCNWYSFVAL